MNPRSFAAIAIWCATFCLTLCLTDSYGQNPYGRGISNSVGSQITEIEIKFRQGYTVIDPSYADNASQLDALREMINSDNIKIDAITAYGYASPEGSVTANISVAQKRAAALKAYFQRNFPSAYPSVDQTNYIPVSWSYLSNDINSDPDFPLKDVTVKLLTSPISEKDKETQLKLLNRGAVYEYFIENILSRYRSAHFHIVWHEKVAKAVWEPETVPEPEPEPEVEQAPEVIMPVEQREPEKIRAARAPKHKVEPALMVKSNALMLATTTFNVGLEYRISRRLSLDVPLLISPYTISERYRIRTWGVQPELRYWPGRFAMPLDKGHFIGLHAHVSAFNVAVGDRRYQDPNRALWGVGLSWGYMRELGQRWRVEFTVGLGYANIEYDVFETGGQGYYIESGHRDYWGVTRLGISFGYKFNLGRSGIR